MFWRFGGYANISTLDSILDKPDVTLEELLDESDLIQELKSQNAKLIEYLRDEAILERLLNYVVAAKAPDSPTLATTNVEKRRSGGLFTSSRSKGRSKSRGENDESEQERQEKQRLKYAYVACEILSSEVWSITEALIDNPELLRPFWSYIDQDAPLDPLQAGYFTKVNESLLEKRPDAMVALIRTLDRVVANMMKHVDCPMVMDLLLKLISLEKTESCQGIVDWLQSQDLIPTLLSCITPEHPGSTQTSAGDFLKAIITISANATGQDSSVIGPNELTRQLVSEACIESLVAEMLKGGNPLTVGVGIIIEVIRKNNSDYDSETQTGPEPKSSDPIYLGTLLRILSTHIAQFMDLILSPNHTVVTATGSKSVPRQDMKVAWGDKIEPLGFDRFKTCELMAELLHCSNMGLLNEKGAEAQVSLRDAERERLKADGKLTSSRAQQTTDEFGTSVDSSGFHHAAAMTPLGESPEPIKRLEVQNSAEDEEFEKVAMSEAVPESETEDFRDILESDEYQAHDLQAREELGDQTRRHADAPRIESLVNKTGQLNLENQATMSNASSLEPAPLNVGAKTTGTTSSTNEVSKDETKSTQQTSGAAPDEGSQSMESEQQKSSPTIQSDDDGSPVVGDLLKIMFVENQVVPTIVDFFFRFPWNNFLHNVVYDVVQQVFNGTMDRGYNRNLAIDLFETGRITYRIMEGQKRSEKAQEERGMRLGYMGHLTLIAEEVVKFTERQPAELLSQSVVDKIMDPDWIHYVEHTLADTRDRDNAILGGVRPDASGGPRQAVLNAVNGGGFGNAVSAALANAGLSGAGAAGLDSMDLANSGAEGYNFASGALLSGFGSSDEEDEEDLEEGEIADATTSLTRQPGLEEDDRAHATILSTDRDSAQQDTGSTPLIPAPLAIPPSRARRQLAKQLAARQRRGSADEGADEKDAGAGSDVATATLSATAGTAATARASKATVSFSHDDDRRGARATEATSSEDEDEGLRRSGSDGSDDEDDRGILARRTGAIADDEDDDDSSGIPRQAIREAAQRRPLDLGDDDEEDIEATSSAASNDDESSDDGGTGSSSKPLRTSSTAAAKEDPAGAAAAKRREQEKLLQQWGLSSDDEVETEEDDEDEDDEEEEDEPVEMGSKFLRKLGSREQPRKP